MPKTAPKPQLTAVTALNPWCCPLPRDPHEALGRIHHDPAAH